MSDKKETKKNLSSSKRKSRRISEEEQSGNDPVSHMMSPDLRAQSSRQSESPAVTTVAGANKPESIVSGCSSKLESIAAAYSAGIREPQSRVSGCRSKLESIAAAAAYSAGLREPENTEANSPTPRRRFSSAAEKVTKIYRGLSLSPKKRSDSSPSLQKSGLNVKSAASTLKDSMTGAASSLKVAVTDVAISVKGVRPGHLSPDKSNLVVTDSECEPPAKIAKKDFYCKIPAFVDRKKDIPKPSGNLTESTSFTSSDAGSSLATDESIAELSSPTEETPLIPPRRTRYPKEIPKKEYVPKKEYIPKDFFKEFLPEDLFDDDDDSS